MNSPAAETRSFKMHANLLWHVISAQAGSQSKAIQELIQNSFDSGSTSINVDVDAKGFRIEDDGKGFTNRAEIELFFETFGQPHDPAEGLRFAAFRIGRGQSMSFATTDWRSGAFRMQTDIKGKGLAYDLFDNLPVVKGCTITGQWYEPLLPSEVDGLVREVLSAVEWVAVPVFVNGRQINRLPQNERWTKVTDDAYILLRDNGPLKLYNCGVRVCDFHGEKFGTGGIVVSREILKVNFARTEVLLNKCETWKRIRKVIANLTNERIRTKPTRLTETERAHLASMGRSGETSFDEFREQKVFADVQDRNLNLDAVLRALDSLRLCVSEPNHVADAAHERKAAFVLHPKTLARFDCHALKEWLSVMKQIVKRGIRHPESHIEEEKAKDALSTLEKVRIVEIDAIKAEIDGGYLLMEEGKLDKRDRALLQIARGMADSICWLARSATKYDCNAYAGARRVVVGASDVALGWTDAEKYIALDQKHLRELRRGFRGALRVATTIAHEYCHDNADTTSHIHDEEFYRAFHDLVGMEYFGSLVEQGVREYAKLLRSQGEIAPTAIAKCDDLSAQTCPDGDVQPIRKAA